MPLAFDIGDEIHLIGTFTDADGQPANPANLEVTLRKPDGTIVSVDPETPDPVGTVEAIYPEADQEGSWWYRFYDSGPPSFAEEASFIVRRRRVPAEES